MMNKLVIIGNLVRDPQMRSTQGGDEVCAFTVAVNRRGKGAQAGGQDADFVRVSAWRDLGRNCGRFLRRGSKVAVSGPVSAAAYLGREGEPRSSLELLAHEVEFLSPQARQEPADCSTDDELPFD